LEKLGAKFYFCFLYFVPSQTTYERIFVAACG